MSRVLLLTFLLACSALAAPPTKLDRLKVGSQTYTNVTVVSVSATDLYFSHDKGIKNVKLRLLDPETRKLFNYDPRTAEDAEIQQSQDDAKFQKSVAARSISSGGTTASTAPNDKRRKSSEDSVADAISEQSRIGKPGPVIGAQKWSGSAPSPTLKDKFVLVTFWTPWSVPCQKWIPQFNALQKKFSDKLDVIGFVPESDADDRSIDLKVEFPFATDEKAKCQTALGIKSVPFVALMDPTGIILYEGHPAALGEKELKALLARPPASDSR